MDRETRIMQKKALHRWEFRCEQIDEGLFIHKATIDNLKVVWNIKHQIGAYTIDNEELHLLFGWDMLDDLMQHTPIY